MRATQLGFMVFALGGCERNSALPTATSAATTLPSSRVTASTARRAAQPLGDAYRGSIGGREGHSGDAALPIVMRLRREGGELRGTYVYEKTGGELELTGTLSGPDLTLTETTAPNKPATGTFSGHLTGDGLLAGTWTGGGPKRPFTLAPIQRRAGAPAIVVKHARRVRRHSEADAGEAAVCTLDLSFPELFGLADAAVEGTLNQKLRKAGDASDEACDVGSDVTTTFEVHYNKLGLISVTIGRADSCASCAHPSAGGEAFTFRTDTGAEVPFDALLAPGGKEKLRALVRAVARARVKAVSGASPEDAPILEDAYLSGSYVLEENGLRLIAFYTLPHAFQGLDSEVGEVLPWAKVASALDPASPAHAAFTSSRP